MGDDQGGRSRGRTGHLPRARTSGDAGTGDRLRGASPLGDGAPVGVSAGESPVQGEGGQDDRDMEEQGRRDAKGRPPLRPAAGEPSALKGACSVRGGAEGKGPQGTSPAAYSTSCHAEATQGDDKGFFDRACRTPPRRRWRRSGTRSPGGGTLSTPRSTQQPSDDWRRIVGHDCSSPRKQMNPG